MDFLGRGGGVFWVLLAGAALSAVGGGLIWGLGEKGLRAENRGIIKGGRLFYEVGARRRSREEDDVRKRVDEAQKREV